MGATDVMLPYPRRRSSIQLEPLKVSLPGEVLTSPLRSPDKPSSDNRRRHTLRSSSSTEDSHGASVLSSESIHLNPLRNVPRRCNSPDEARCHSCDFTMPNRSHSLHRLDKKKRPGESRSRHITSYSEDAESTAQFIERIRKELIQQL